jgi:hypothetical protein
MVQGRHAQGKQPQIGSIKNERWKSECGIAGTLEAEIILPGRQIAEAEDALDRRRGCGELRGPAGGHDSGSGNRPSVLVEYESLDGSEPDSTFGQAAVETWLDGYRGNILRPKKPAPK